MARTPRLKYLLEFLILKGFEWVFRALPVGAASALGGALVQAVGPHLKRHVRAQQQLKGIFPEWTDRQRETVLRQMWNNVGRTTAEFLSLPNATLLRNMTLHGEEHLSKPGVPTIYLTAHMGNWELLPALPHSVGTPIVVMHRLAANPLSESVIERKRMIFAHSLASKSTHGVAQVVRALKQKRGVGMLTDLRISGDVEAPLFGRPAMTSSLPAELAVKYGAVIVPARIVRRHGSHFDAYILPPITWDPTGNLKADALAITSTINAIYETWIRETPAQWLWFHERFGKGYFPS